MKQQPRLAHQLWAALICSLLGVYLVFRSIGGLNWRALLVQLKWEYFMLGLVFLFIVWLSKAWRIYLLTRAVGHQTGIWRLFQIYLATCFIAHVTPFNSGGTPLQILLLNRQGISAGKATAITLVDLVLNTLWFILLIPIALLSNLDFLAKLRFKSLAWERLGWLVLITIGVLGLAYWSWRGGLYRRNLLFKRLRSYLHRKGWLTWIRWELGRFKEGWSLLMQYNRGIIWWAVVAGGVYWCFYLALAPLAILTLGKSVSYFNLIGWQLLFNFGQLLIPTPGGTGGSELLLAYLFRDFTGQARLGAFVLIWKGYTFFSTLILGGYAFIKLTGGWRFTSDGLKQS